MTTLTAYFFDFIAISLIWIAISISQWKEYKESLKNGYFWFVLFILSVSVIILTNTHLLK